MMFAALLTCAIRPVTAQVLPTEYAGERFYVIAETLDGKRLKLFTDTGGGLFMLKSSAERLGLRLEPVEEDGRPGFQTTFPPFKSTSTIPPPKSDSISVYDMPASEAKFLGDADGMLGQAWFAERVWTFDYAARQLILHEGSPPINPPSARTVSLGFKTGSSGKRERNFPRIELEVDSKKLEMLFDTGATTFLSDEALKKVGDNDPAERATSFITKSVFESWRSAHPDWPVIEKAETTTGEAMILVPQVTIAGFSAGPIWFTRRADNNFHKYMSQWMDKRIDGAVGGNILRNFTVRVDYPTAQATFVPREKSAP